MVVVAVSPPTTTGCRTTTILVLTSRHLGEDQDHAMKTIRLNLTVLAIALCNLASDSASATTRGGPSPVVQDTTDTVVIENERPPPDSRLPWRIGAEPSLTIGSVTSGGPDQLYRVEDATRLPDGRIVIANAGSSELRVFNPDGSHSATWGRRGEGPGEFTAGSPDVVAPWPGDSIAAPNRWGGRLSIFDQDGNHGRDVHLELGVANVVDLLPDGGIVTGGIAGMHGGMTGSTGLVRPDVEWKVLGPDGKLDASFGKFPGTEWWAVFARGGQIESSQVHPFGRNTIGAVWGDLVAIGDQAGYEIKAFEADGSLVRIIRRDGELGSPTRAEQDSYWERRYANRPPDRRAESLKAVKDMPVVDSYPAFSGILSDRLGNLWVRERWSSVWTVFDQEGRVRGLVEMPSGLSVFEIGEDYVLGRSSKVVLLRWTVRGQS